MGVRQYGGVNDLGPVSTKSVVASTIEKQAMSTVGSILIGNTISDRGGPRNALFGGIGDLLKGIGMGVANIGFALIGAPLNSRIMSLEAKGSKTEARIAKAAMNVLTAPTHIIGGAIGLIGGLFNVIGKTTIRDFLFNPRGGLAELTDSLAGVSMMKDLFKAQRIAARGDLPKALEHMRELGNRESFGEFMHNKESSNVSMEAQKEIFSRIPGFR